MIKNFVLLILSLSCWSFLFWGILHYTPASISTTQNSYNRIISLAPGITSTLHYLKLTDKLYGVTYHCPWPESAGPKPVLGGYKEANTEAIVRANPDLVLVPDDMGWFASLLTNMGIKVLSFNNRTLSGYLQSTEQIGNILNRSQQAQELIASLTTNYLTSPNSYKPKTIFALLDRHECELPIQELTILGRDGFYDELISRAGGTNAYLGSLAYPRLGREALLALQPELVIASVAACKNPENTGKNLLEIYGESPPNLLLLDKNEDTIPGPGAILTFTKISNELVKISRHNN